MPGPELPPLLAGDAATAAPGADLLAGFAATTEFALLFIDQHGRINFVNAAVQRMFGYDEGEMLGRTLDLIIPARLRGAHTAGVARIAAGGPPN